MAKIQSTQVYPRGVEVTTNAVIVHDGKVLMMQSPKWGEIWLFPAGHVDPGESLFAATEREAEEEVGIVVKASVVLQVGELVNDPDFNRKAHLIYFHVLCSPQSEEIKSDPREVNLCKWFPIDEAIAISKSGDTTGIVLERVRNNCLIDFDSHIYI